MQGQDEIDSLPFSMCSWGLKASHETAILPIWLPLHYGYPNNRITKSKDWKRAQQVSSSCSWTGVRIVPKSLLHSPLPLQKPCSFDNQFQGQRKRHLNIKQGIPLHIPFASE
jgi:hypothetical protein